MKKTLSLSSRFENWKKNTEYIYHLIYSGQSCGGAKKTKIEMLSKHNWKLKVFHTLIGCN